MFELPNLGFLVFGMILEHLFSYIVFLGVLLEGTAPSRRTPRKTKLLSLPCYGVISRHRIHFGLGEKSNMYTFIMRTPLRWPFNLIKENTSTSLYKQHCFSGF